MKKYLWFFEDGEVILSDTEPEEDQLESLEQFSFHRLIRLSDQKQYYDGDWHDIRVDPNDKEVSNG